MNINEDNQLTRAVIGVDEPAYEAALCTRLTAEGITHKGQVPLR